MPKKSLKIESNFYKFLEYFEKRPLMFLGTPNVEKLSGFLLGLSFFREPNFIIDENHNFPNFELFTLWIGGMLNYPHENSSGGWSWLLLEKYKKEDKAFYKFFELLNKFKNSKIVSQTIKIKTENKEYCINNKISKIWCKTGNINEKEYFENIKKIESIIFYQLKPSKTIFTLLLDKNGKIIESRNNDITGKQVIKDLEKQFNIKIDKKQMTDSNLTKKEIIKYRIK